MRFAIACSRRQPCCWTISCFAMLTGVNAGIGFGWKGNTCRRPEATSRFQRAKNSCRPASALAMELRQRLQVGTHEVGVRRHGIAVS